MALTADTITDADIEALFSSLPPGHYAVQWCLDARFPSSSHPHRQRNARRQCAEILNARAKEECCPNFNVCDGFHASDCSKEPK